MSETGRVRFAVEVADSSSGLRFKECGLGIGTPSAGGSLSGTGLAVFHVEFGQTGHWRQMDGRSRELLAQCRS